MQNQEVQLEFVFKTSHPDMIGDVDMFHRKFVPHPPPGRPTFVQSAVDFRMRFLDEEFNTELKEAVEQRDLPAIADAIGDIIYVAIGFARELGIPLQAVWHEIQRSNMEKVRPTAEDDSWKYCVKPAGWLAPRVKEILEQHGYVEGEVLP